MNTGKIGVQRLDETSSKAFLGVWNELISVATGFRKSALLLAALELDVFEVVQDCDDPTAEDIAKALGMNVQPTRVMLDALAGLELLDLGRGRYFVPAHLRSYLLAGDASMTSDLMRYREEFEVWHNMVDILSQRKNAPESYSRELFDGKASNFPGLARFNTIHANALCDIFSKILPPFSSVLDVGGGDGVLAACLLEAFANCSVTVFELDPKAISPNLAKVQRTFPERLRILHGDARDFTHKAQYDLVVLNEMLELFGRVDKLAILKRAAAAMHSHGALACIKFRLEENRRTPLSSAIFSMRMMIKAGGYLESEAELDELLRETGLKPFHHEAVGSLKTLTLASRRATG